MEQGQKPTSRRSDAAHVRVAPSAGRIPVAYVLDARGLEIITAGSVSSSGYVLRFRRVASLLRRGFLGRAYGTTCWPARVLGMRKTAPRTPPPMAMLRGVNQDIAFGIGWGCFTIERCLGWNVEHKG